jgi:hypothetical protein
VSIYGQSKRHVCRTRFVQCMPGGGVWYALAYPASDRQYKLGTWTHVCYRSCKLCLAMHSTDADHISRGASLDNRCLSG